MVLELQHGVSAAFLVLDENSNSDCDLLLGAETERSETLAIRARPVGPAA